MDSSNACFDWASHFYDYTRAIPDELMNQTIVALRERIEICPGDKLLDIGIGTGRLAIPISEKLNVDLIGIDISEKMLQKCRKKVNPLKNVCLIVADGLALPFTNNQFNLVFTSHVLHLLSDPFQIIRNITHLLTKNGYYANLDAYVNYHKTIPFKIYYNKLSESGYRHIVRGNLIRQEITIFLSKRGWFYHKLKINGQKEMILNDIVKFIRDRVFSHQRAITEDFHQQSLKFLYQELETRSIDLSEKVIVPATSHITLFQRHVKTSN